MHQYLFDLQRFGCVMMPNWKGNYADDGNLIFRSIYTPNANIEEENDALLVNGLYFIQMGIGLYNPYMKQGGGNIILSKKLYTDREVPIGYYFR